MIDCWVLSSGSISILSSGLRGKVLIKAVVILEFSLNPSCGGSSFYRLPKNDYEPNTWWQETDLWAQIIMAWTKSRSLRFQSSRPLSSHSKRIMKEKKRDLPWILSVGLRLYPCPAQASGSRSLMSFLYTVPRFHRLWKPCASNGSSYYVEDKDSSIDPTFTMP